MLVRPGRRPSPSPLSLRQRRWRWAPGAERRISIQSATATGQKRRPLTGGTWTAFGGSPAETARGRCATRRRPLERAVSDVEQPATAAGSSPHRSLSILYNVRHQVQQGRRNRPECAPQSPLHILPCSHRQGLPKDGPVKPTQDQQLQVSTHAVSDCHTASHFPSHHSSTLSTSKARLRRTFPAPVAHPQAPSHDR